jgi:hypothetical protein
VLAFGRWVMGGSFIHLHIYIGIRFELIEVAHSSQGPSDSSYNPTSPLLSLPQAPAPPPPPHNTLTCASHHFVVETPRKPVIHSRARSRPASITNNLSQSKSTTSRHSRVTNSHVCSNLASRPRAHGVGMRMCRRCGGYKRERVPSFLLEFWGTSGVLFFFGWLRVCVCVSCSLSRLLVDGYFLVES